MVRLELQDLGRMAKDLNEVFVFRNGKIETAEKANYSKE